MNEFRYILLGVTITVLVFYLVWMIKNIIDLHKSKQAVYIIDFEKNKLNCSRCTWAFSNHVFECYDLYEDTVRCPICGRRIKGIRVLKEGDKK